MNHAFVTGAAGFIGSNLVDRLLSDGIRVTGWDNFSTGQEKFLLQASNNPLFRLIRGDNLDLAALTSAMGGCDFVFHLAANADVRFGTQHTRKDLEQNTIATYNVLEAMRANSIKRIAFSSTGSTYGEATVFPTPETAPFPIQTSLYGASKVASEGLISAYSAGFNFEAYIFRFVSILGERYTHGHIFDFHRQLLEHPTWLQILGDGRQKKSYLYVQDCIDAIIHVVSLQTATLNKPTLEVYNLGTNEYVEVSESVACICEKLRLTPQLRFTGGERGWIGDSPFIFLDTAKIRATGWHAKKSIKDGIRQTLAWLESNKWVYDVR